MRIVAILQARMGSTRLPGKMLLPLLDKPLVQHVIERTLRATRLHDVVLAFPVHDAPAFSPLRMTGVSLYAFPGSEHDLVARYLGAAQAYRADIIVRIPCDNPCVDPGYIDAAVEAYLRRDYIFYQNAVTMIEGQYLDGIGCEILSRSRLTLLDHRTQGQAALREHPHKAFGDYVHVLQTMGLPYRRLDVNTQQDYEFIRDLFDHFGHNHFTAAEIVAFLTTQEVSHARSQSPAHTG